MMYVPFNEHRLYVQRQGRGKPLIILNGIMMSTASWLPFLDQLTPYMEVILLDLLDQGQSSKLEDQTYDISLQVEAVYTVIQACGLESAYVLGISYGAEVAQALAITYPHVVSKLMLFNSTCKTNRWLKEIGNSWIAAANNPQAFYSATIPTIYSANFFEVEQQWMAQREQTLLQVFENPMFMSAMIRLTKSAETFNVCDQLHQITCETLVVGAKHDTITPVDQQQLIASKIPNAHLVILENSGHASMYEQPRLFTSLVVGFVLVDHPGFSTKG